MNLSLPMSCAQARGRLSSQTLRVLLSAAALSMIAAQLPSPAQAEDSRVRVRIDSVMAADTNEGFDPDLESMRPILTELFRYSTYRLVSHQEGKAKYGDKISFELPGGAILNVEPRGVDGDMIAMELILFEGPRHVMTTDLKLNNGGILMIGGPHYDDGMLIISIGADSRVHPQHAAATRASTAKPAASQPAATPVQQH